MGVKTLHFELSALIDPEIGLPQNFQAMIMQIQSFITANKMHAVSISVDEITDWDVSAMRRFFHGVIISAYVRKFNETTNNPLTGHFTKELAKRYLKAKFLGYVRDWRFTKWERLLNLSEIGDVLDFIRIDHFIGSVVERERPVIVSTVDITPEDYWELINQCEAYYLHTFNDMYDRRNKPEYKKESEQ